MYTALAAVVLGIAFYFYHRSQHEHDAFARCLTARGAKCTGVVVSALRGGKGKIRRVV